MADDIKVSPFERTPPPGHKLIVEGSAAIPFKEDNEVFYNNVQEFNRDMSVAVIRYFQEVRLRENATKKLQALRGREKKQLSEADRKELDDTDWGAKAKETATTEGLRVLDALAATALRSVRYIKEIPGIKHVTVNDLDKAASEAAKRNMEFNEVDPSLYTVRRSEATLVMYEGRSPAPAAKQFDVIDIDPYGACAPFLDAAVSSVVEGGLICVTSTDMAVLTGSHPEVAYAKYGSVPTHAAYLHEMALRVILHALQSSASRYRRYIEPLLSCSMDFYVRLFVRVHTSPTEVKKTFLNSAYVLQSTQCPSFRLVPVGKMGGNNGTSWQPAIIPADGGVCPQTGGSMKIGGPIWSAPIHNFDFAKGLMDKLRLKIGGWDKAATWKRMLGTMSTINEELPDIPLHYTVPSLAETLRSSQPKQAELFAAFFNAGYKVSQTHREPTAIKTDAPEEVVFDIMRCWVKKHPVSAKRQADKNSPGQLILSRPNVFEANFTVPAWLRAKKAAKKEAPRFPLNPEANWGPKSRASGKRKILVAVQRAFTNDAQAGDGEGEAGAGQKRKKRRKGAVPAQKEGDEEKVNGDANGLGADEKAEMAVDAENGAEAAVDDGVNGADGANGGD